jgi:hypothetical protein
MSRPSGRGDRELFEGVATHTTWDREHGHTKAGKVVRVGRECVADRQGKLAAKKWLKLILKTRWLTLGGVFAMHGGCGVGKV